MALEKANPWGTGRNSQPSESLATVMKKEKLEKMFPFVPKEQRDEIFRKNKLIFPTFSFIRLKY